MPSAWYPPQNRLNVVSGRKYYRRDSYLTYEGVGEKINYDGTSTSVNIEVPYRRIVGQGGGYFSTIGSTTSDTSLSKTFFTSFHMEQTAIYVRGILLTALSPQAEFSNRVFAGLPTKFKLYGSNDGINWSLIFNRSTPLIVTDLYANRRNFSNDTIATPIVDLDVYTNVSYTTSVNQNISSIKTGYFEEFTESNVAYNRFKIEFDKSSTTSAGVPNYRIDKQLTGANIDQLYMPQNGGFRLGNFALYGDTIKNSANNNISDNNIMSVIIQLPTLDASSNIGTAATYPADYTESLDSVQGNLYYKASVADLQAKFTFSTNGTLNDGSVPLVYASTARLLKSGVVDASYGVSSVSYTSGTAPPSDASTNVVLDYATETGQPYGKTAETFIQYVAESVFGSKLAVDMLLNEPAIATSYIASVNSCIVSVNDKFVNSAADASGASQKIYQVMTGSKEERFGMMYTSDLSGTIVPVGTYSCTARRSGDVGDAAVTVVIDASGVRNMSVTTAGTGYAIGDRVTLKDASGVLIARIVSINSVQTAMLNGTLSSQTGFPFEAADQLWIKFTLRTNSGQTNVAGNPAIASIDVNAVITAV